MLTRIHTSAVVNTLANVLSCHVMSGAWRARGPAAVGKALKLKKCVLTRPQRLRSHAYSRTRLERSPSTVTFTLSGFSARRVSETVVHHLSGLIRRHRGIGGIAIHVCRSSTCGAAHIRAKSGFGEVTCIPVNFTTVFSCELPACQIWAAISILRRASSVSMHWIRMIEF